MKVHTRTIPTVQVKSDTFQFWVILQGCRVARRKAQTVCTQRACTGEFFFFFNFESLKYPGTKVPTATIPTVYQEHLVLLQLWPKTPLGNPSGPLLSNLRGNNYLSFPQLAVYLKGTRRAVVASVARRKAPTLFTESKHSEINPILLPSSCFMISSVYRQQNPSAVQ